MKPGTGRRRNLPVPHQKQADRRLDAAGGLRPCTAAKCGDSLGVTNPLGKLPMPEGRQATRLPPAARFFYRFLFRSAALVWFQVEQLFLKNLQLGAGAEGLLGIVAASWLGHNAHADGLDGSR